MVKDNYIDDVFLSVVNHTTTKNWQWPSNWDEQRKIDKQNRNKPKFKPKKNKGYIVPKEQEIKEELVEELKEPVKQEIKEASIGGHRKTNKKTRRRRFSKKNKKRSNKKTIKN